jgi:outer membrane protein OmpA-like peptidoglycan-associated protein
MDEESNQWMSIADVMSVLMMIFMFLSVAFIYQLQNTRETFRDELNAALHKEFDKDLERWMAEITPDNIFRFNAPFTEGESQLPDLFGETLEEYFPRYIAVLTSPRFVSEIDELRIEGHTSYGWGPLTSRNEVYLNNMRLSQARASAVLEFSYNLDHELVNDKKDWLETHLRSNGMAYSNLILQSGEVAKTFDLQEANQQNKTRSRRVEFKVVMKPGINF